jgi:hypothetical protein
MAQYISLTSSLKLKVQYDETLSLELHEVESSKRSRVHKTKMPENNHRRKKETHAANEA